MLILGSSLVALVGGILMWRLGARGRRLDLHPVCRSCRYDLVGLPGDAVRCSECGADLKTKQAIVVGNRVRWPGIAWGGLLLSVLSLPAVGFSGREWWQHFDKLKWLPFAFLEREYKSGNFNAGLELESRMTRGKKSVSQANQLVRDMIAWQDDPRIIAPYADLIISSAGLHAGASPALLTEYYAHPFRVDVRSHAQVNRNSFFAFRLAFDMRPRLEYAPMKIEVEHVSARVQFGDRSVRLMSPDELRLSEDTYDRDSMVVGTDDLELWTHEHAGRIQGTLIVEMDVKSRVPPPHIVRTAAFSANVLPVGSPAIRFVKDPELDRKMAAAFHAEGVEMDDRGRLLLWRGLPPSRFDIGTLPENVALQVYYEQAGHQWPQGVLIREAGRQAIEMYYTPKLERDLAPEPPSYFIGGLWRMGSSFREHVATDLRSDLPLTLVLKSDAHLAQAHSGFDKVWEGEIRIPIPIHVVPTRVKTNQGS